MSADERTEARPLSHQELFHKFNSADRERLVELLICRTTADIARGDALHQAALSWLEAAEAPIGRSDAIESSEKTRPRPAQRVG